MSKPVPQTSSVRPDQEVQLLCKDWHEIVKKVGHTAPLAKQYLLDAKPMSIKDNMVYIGFDPEFAENKKSVDLSRNVLAVQNVLEEWLKRSLKVTFFVLDANETLPGDIKMNTSDDTVDGVLAPAAKVRKNMSLEAKGRWQKNEAVKDVLEVFGGDIVDIRE